MASADISRQFQQILGRDATPDEISYLDKFIQENGLSPQEINFALQGMPEAQGRQLTADTQAYGAQLAQGDQGILDKAAATAQSRFASLGRPVTSGQVGALAQTGQNLAMNRQSMLADFYGRGLQNIAGNRQTLGGGMLERGYGLRDETRQRGYQVEDRNYMKNMYDEYSARQARGQRAGALGQMGGSLLGAGLGAALAYPTGGMSMGMGAMLGSQMGGGAGRNAGGLFGGY